MPGRTSARRGGATRRASSRRRRASSARRGRPAGPATTSAVVDGDGGDEPALPPGLGRRAAASAGAAPSGRLSGAAAATTSATHGADATSCRTVSVAAAPMSPNCVAWRQISTSIVDAPTPPSRRTTPNDVNVNTKTIAAAARIAGRSSGSVTSRNARHGDAPSVAAAASRSGGSWLPHGADGAHDDGEVEHDVGDDDRRRRPRSSACGSRARKAAPIDHRRQHERRR